MGAIGVELRICLLAASRECDVTGKLEVIAWSIGLVPRNALVLTGLATFRMVGKPEVILEPDLLVVRLSTSFYIALHYQELTHHPSDVWLAG